MIKGSVYPADPEQADFNGVCNWEFRLPHGEPFVSVGTAEGFDQIVQSFQMKEDALTGQPAAVSVAR